MPVLITAAAISYFFRSGDRADRGSFLDPGGLRARVEDELDGEGEREGVLRLVGDLKQVASRYDAVVRRALGEYAAHAESGEFSTESILEIFAPVDVARADSMRELVRLRGAVLARLSEEQWGRLFD